MGVFVSNAGIGLGIVGNEHWSGSFPLRLKYEQITPGTYVVDTKLLDGSISCNATSATFTITNVAYVDGKLDVLDLTYNQTCTLGGTISGQLHYWAEDPTTAPAPTNPIPSNLWQPGPSFVAPSGNYMYLEGSAGDPISKGQNFLLTDNLFLSQHGNTIEFQAPSSAYAWKAKFSAPIPYALIPVGYYGSFTGVANPVFGTLDVSTFLTCAVPASGWFTVDSIRYSATNGIFQIAELELRFEQVCSKGNTPLRGKIHWSAPISGLTLTNQMPALATPIKIAPSTLPSGNACQRAMTGIVTPLGTPGQTFVALDSQLGDYLGQGGSYCYTLANAKLPVSIIDKTINITVAGDDSWNGAFPVTVINGQIQTGSYQAGSWSGNGRGCSNLASKVNVTNATYVNGSLSALDLNFQMRCDASTEELNGVIHWWANDPTGWPGPATTGTENLWKPMPAFIPPAGNYVYLEGTGDDYISLGLAYLYTPAVKPIVFEQLHLNAIGITVGEKFSPAWQIYLQGSQALTRIQPGLYKNMTRYPFNNPVTGGLSASGLHRGCNNISGWYMIDKITYSATDQITELDARFEQYCLAYGASSLTPLHGQIHWVAN
ncbi:MAG: hypothetical protein V4857_28650 [Pseudomonadota bacterium]